MTRIRVLGTILLMGWGACLWLVPVTTFAQESSEKKSSESSSFSIHLSQPIGGTSEVKDLGEYIAVAYRYMIGLSFTAALVMVIYGGFLYLIGASTGKSEEGRKIIIDALAGFALVMGAYTILSLINPAMVRLQWPTIERIQPQQLKFSEGKALEVTRQSQACSLDADCPTGEACMRTQYIHARYNNVGADAARDLASAATRGLVSGGSGETQESPNLDEEQDRRVHSGGFCSNGSVGTRCRCAGEGCGLTFTGSILPTSVRAGVVATGAAEALGEARSEGGGTSARIVGDAAVQSFRNRYKTNNNWTGVRSCQGGSTCIFFIGGTEGERWVCQNVNIRNATDIQTARQPIQQRIMARAQGAVCNTDAECGSGGYCMRIDTSNTSRSGECSRGALGERCKCRSFGCATFPGVSNRIRQCASGFECQLFGQPNVDGMNADWYCAQPVPGSTLAGGGGEVTASAAPASSRLPEAAGGITGTAFLASILNSTEATARPMIDIIKRQTADVSTTIPGVTGLRSVSEDARECAIYRNFHDRHYPEFLRNMVAVTITVGSNRATFYVTPDVLSIGTNDDFIRMPMWPGTAQKIANDFGMFLPTKKMIDAMKQAAPRTVAMSSQAEARSHTFVYIQNNQRIQTRVGGVPSGMTIGGKKIIYLNQYSATETWSTCTGGERCCSGTTRPADCPARTPTNRHCVGIYGGWRENGTLVQDAAHCPHDSHYVDYSHGVYLVAGRMEMNGQQKTVDEVLRDPTLSRLISDAVITNPHYSTSGEDVPTCT